MNEVSLLRVYILRALYLFVVVGTAVFVWPEIINPAEHWGVSQGLATCMIASFSLMCLLGLRYPLQMLPVLLWEVTWKTLWLAIVPLPQWMAGHLAPALQPSVFACSMVVLVYLAVPWRYVFAHYVTAPATSWR
ncbi:MAG: hypothetical protein WDN04_19575 [Rhodospirillales bacterium]